MIKLKGITRTYKGKGITTPALRGVDINIEKGEFVAIMGRSGCGKTTLLNIIGCMDYFDEGEYTFENTNIKSLGSGALAHLRNKRIGFVFQSFNLINEINALKNVEVPLGYGGVGARKRRETSMARLKEVGLKDWAKHKPTQLSGGQQQRVAIARALANDPDIILADEPTGNLDSKNGEEIMDILKKLNDKGVTMIMVTHDETVASCAKRRILLFDGLVVSDGAQ